MNKQEIIKYITILNERLSKIGVKTDMYIYGGVVMCLVFGVRESTDDIDELFKEQDIMDEIAEQIAEQYNLGKFWLHNEVGAVIFKDDEFNKYAELSNITIMAPSPEFMLAMKCRSGRFGKSNDFNDIKFLMKNIGIKEYEDVL